VVRNCGTIILSRVEADDAPLIAAAIDAPEDELKDLQRGHGGYGRCKTAPALGAAYAD